jgi:hypothetical protein
MLSSSVVARSDILAVLGMGLIIVGVSLSLARDMRHRFGKVEDFFTLLERRIPANYIPFLAPACIAAGILDIVLAVILG